MAITVNHQFVSAKGDGTDATVVRPSNWNASHNINLATNKIIGRLTAGTGLAEELSVTSYMIGLLNTADFAALAVALGLPTTGDAKLTFKLVADSGWVLANDGSVGDALSGGTTRANADTLALFTLFYNSFSDSVAPLLTSTGALTTRVAQGTAAVAYSVHCRMTIPKQLGRALIVAGAGAGLTNRVVGAIGGEENHQLTIAEMPLHAHQQQGTFAGAGSSAATGGGTGGGVFSGSGVANGDTGGISANHSHALNFASGGIDRGIDHLHGFSTSNSDPVHSHQYNGPVANSSTTGGGTFGIVGTTSTQGTQNASINHSHGGTTGAADRSLDHLHNVSGNTGFVSSDHTHHISNIGVSVSGGVTVTSLSVSVNGSANVNTTISGPTGSAGNDAVHNIMQPWVAWNIMIKL